MKKEKKHINELNKNNEKRKYGTRLWLKQIGQDYIYIYIYIYDNTLTPSAFITKSHNGAVAELNSKEIYPSTMSPMQKDSFAGTMFWDVSQSSGLIKMASV